MPAFGTDSCCRCGLRPWRGTVWKVGAGDGIESRRTDERGCRIDGDARKARENADRSANGQERGIGRIAGVTKTTLRFVGAGLLVPLVHRTCLARRGARTFAPFIGEQRCRDGKHYGGGSEPGDLATQPECSQPRQTRPQARHLPISVALTFTGALPQTPARSLAGPRCPAPLSRGRAVRAAVLRPRVPDSRAPPQHGPRRALPQTPARSLLIVSSSLNRHTP